MASNNLQIDRKRTRLYEAISDKDEKAIRKAAETPDVRMNRNIIKTRRKNAGKHKPSQLAKERAAMKEIDSYILKTAALGLIPLPIIDLSAITYQQLGLVKKINRIYEQELKDDLGLSLIKDIWNGYNPITAGGSFFGSMIKSIPVLGAVIGGPAVGILAAASTYAIGKTFIDHLKTSGSIQSFNPDKEIGTYRKYVEEGKKYLRTRS